MTRSSTKELVNYDPEIERPSRFHRKQQTTFSQYMTCGKMEK